MKTMTCDVIRTVSQSVWLWLLLVQVDIPAIRAAPARDVQYPNSTFYLSTCHGNLTYSVSQTLTVETRPDAPVDLDCVLYLQLEEREQINTAQLVFTRLQLGSHDYNNCSNSLELSTDVGPDPETLNWAMTLCPGTALPGTVIATSGRVAMRLRARTPMGGDQGLGFTLHFSRLGTWDPSTAGGTDSDEIGGESAGQSPAGSGSPGLFNDTSCHHWRSIAILCSVVWSIIHSKSVSS